MKHSDLALTTAFGVVLGTTVTLWLGESCVLMADLVPSLIVASTTVAVGWWIHSAVRRRGELDRIPIDYISELNQRIDRLTSVCLAASDRSERVASTVRLSNEVYWLTVLLKKMRPASAPLGDKLAAHYVDFKEHLTAHEDPELLPASGVSHEVRMAALAIQWHLCRHVLDRRTGDNVFGLE